MADPRTQLKGSQSSVVRRRGAEPARTGQTTSRRNDDRETRQGQSGSSGQSAGQGELLSQPGSRNLVNDVVQASGLSSVNNAVGAIGGAVGGAVGDVAGGVGGLLGGINPFQSQPIPNFPAFQVDPIAQQNFQGLFGAPAIQPQQVIGGGSIAGQVPTVTPQNVTAAQLSTDQINAAQKLGLQTRGQQQGAIGQLQSAAAGQTPSAAQIQGGQQLDAALRNQLALASSARGGAAQQAAAQRQAQRGIGQLQQGAIGDAAALRAQEQATARDALSGALLGVRGQDAALQQLALQQSGAQAQLGQQAALANQSAGLQGGIANQGATLAALQADQANRFRVDSANQQAGLQASGLDIQRQLGGAQGVLGAQELAALAQFRPLGLQAQVAAAERQRQGQLQGALLQGGAGILTKLIGLG